MTTPETQPTWFGRLRPRFAAHWPLKACVIPLFITGFFAAYFYLLQHPRFAVTLMPVTALDRLIGFHPTAMVPYVSLWFYATLAAGMMRGRGELLGYGAAVLAVTVTGFATFLFWPTATPTAAVDWARYPSFAFLRAVDASGNACPSLHVAFAVLSACWLGRLLRGAGAPRAWQVCNGAWCVAIVYSTLATRQHVVVDVLAGAVLGGAAGWFGPRPEAGLRSDSAGQSVSVQGQ